MAQAAREAGAIIRTGADVSRILTRDHRATGVALLGGEEIRARRIVSNADPKRSFLTLLDSADLPPSFVAAVRAYRCEGASIKMNLAVSELPRLRGDDGGGTQPYHRGLIQITKPLSELDRDQEAARAGLPAALPHAELCIPT